MKRASMVSADAYATLGHRAHTTEDGADRAARCTSETFRANEAGRLGAYPAIKIGAG
jgi:hypothetical protein